MLEAARGPSKSITCYQTSLMNPQKKKKIVLRTQKVHKFYFSSFFFSTLLDASNSNSNTKNSIINSECGNSKLIRHKEGKWEWECLTAFYCYLLCYPFFTTRYDRFFFYIFSSCSVAVAEMIRTIHARKWNRIVVEWLKCIFMMMIMDCFKALMEIASLQKVCYFWASD